jgi:hypothetical protein
MQATKYTVTVTVEVLSLDAVEGMLHSVGRRFGEEITAGMIRQDDGDGASWHYTSTDVEF